jgi:hypothetical protein
MQRAIFELDALGLAASEKFHSVLAHQRHVLQIQNQFLRGGFDSKQLLQVLDVLRGLDPAAERKQNLTVPFSLSSQHASSLCLRTPDAGWNFIPFVLADAW